MASLLWCVSAIFILNFVNGEIRISLNSNGNRNVWTVRNESNNAQITATVPGGIYSDLKLTEELFYRQNDVAYRWVGLENWIYETKFELTKEILNKNVVNLVFHGIDTIGNISLNGQHLGSVNNMFVRYVFSIKEVAQVGSNVLQVRLMSPIKEANKSQAAYDYPVPPDCPHPAQNGECHINFLRKMQASFSWSMGPAVPSVGIWKSVELEAFDTAIVRDVVAKVRRQNETYWLIDVNCHYEGSTNISGYGLLTSISIDDKQITIRTNPLNDSDSEEIDNFYNNVTFGWLNGGDQIWWPNGYGRQPLLILTCAFQSSVEAGEEISSKQIKIGLRHIELVQETSEDKIQPFYFKVNGVPIFAKGANWIPGHILPELGYDEKMLRRTLQSAKDANMNMLRVWGGGVYESDLFYQICDELGILVWQDMMFTSALYPSSDMDFIFSVSSEIEQQVKRMIGHASLALWSGNDEIQQALAENWYTLKNDAMYHQDYTEIFENTVKRIIEEIDDSGRFVISSPSNGLRTIENASGSENPNDGRYGDVHDMDHSYDPWNFYSAPTVRFASKYGFQSLPSAASIYSCSLAEDRNLKSEFSKNRQHVQGGYDEIKKLIEYHFSLPKEDEWNSYESFIYYSQLSQALATKAQSERHRKNRGYFDNDFSTTMGALYWHLNDVWQAPSWSSIEFGGRWKMLHYYAKKFFAPVIIVPEVTPRNTVNVYIVSDLLNDIPCELSISIYSWSSFKPKSVTLYQQVVVNSSSLIYTTFSMSNSMKVSNCDSTTCFLHFKLSGEGISTENFVYPSHFSKITNLAPAKLTATAAVNNDRPKEILILLKADRIVPFIWLETDAEGIFSDNGFTLIEESVSIKFTNRGEEIDCKKFQHSIVIRSLDQWWSADVTCGSGSTMCHKLGLTALLLYFMTYVKVFY